MAPILRSVIFNGSPAASLADLTSEEVRSFMDLKIETLTDLMLLEPEDFDNILGNDAHFVRSKHHINIFFFKCCLDSSCTSLCKLSPVRGNFLRNG